MTSPRQKLLNQFENKRSVYVTFADHTKSLLETILQSKHIRPHSVTARVKTAASLKEKISRPQKNYKALEDITDLVGLRIITYFHDQVDQVAKIIEQEFNIDIEHSVDKRSTVSPDSFGYASVHKICALSPERLKLPEYARFKGMVCEIQIRSILQHTWAEIEHDLGYKNALSIPHRLKRSFSKLAALLELADDEFLRLREELAGYQEKVRLDFTKHPQNIDIDPITLAYFIKKDRYLLKMEKEIARKKNGSLDESLDNQAINIASAFWASDLARIGIRTIESLRNSLRSSRAIIESYCDHNISPGDSLHRGFAIFTLVLLSIGQSRDEKQILETLREMGMQPKNSPSYVKHLMEFFGVLDAAKASAPLKSVKLLK